MLLKYFTSDEEIAEVTLATNLEKYDYFHEIILRQNGTVTLLDGGSQCVYGVVEGSYDIEIISSDKIQFKFFNLILHDPYDQTIEFSKIEPIQVTAIKKDINYIFNPPYEEKRTYNTCYDFEYDPLIVFRDNCSKYAEKYIPESIESGLFLHKSDPDFYATNGVRINPLETRYYLNLDEKEL